ncbi:MAG: Dabb family protein [Pirellulaceae bacterium]
MRCLRPLAVLASLCVLIGFIGCDKPATVNTDTGTTQTESNNTTTANDAVVAETPQEAKETVVSNYKDSVLRHAVFFKFKAESSEADVKGVADAFAALPTKVPEIIDFQWGKNNSPEGLDDGFTHCFLLTFADEKGREVYLPHAAHKAFGDVLRPHMDDVFVIDYWGKAGDSGIEKELKHAVFFKFKDDAPADGVKKVEAAFAALPSKIDAIKSFEWGKNNSPEKHDDGFTHCFMVTFDSDEGREVYLPHPDHKAFVEVLGPVLDKVRVLDFFETK